MTKSRTSPSAPDIEELQRLKLMQDMQKELVSWAKSRLAPLTMAVAVLGFFGLKTVIDQNIASLVNSKVDVQVNRQIGRMDEAASKAAQQSGQLSAEIENTNKAADDAKRAADEARKVSAEAASSGNDVKERLSLLQPQIDQAKASVNDIEERLNKVKKDADEASGNISYLSGVLFDRSRKQFQIGRQDQERIDAFERKQAELAAAFEGLVRSDPRQAQQSRALLGRLEDIDRQYRESVARIDKRKAASVVLMVGKGEASEKAARMAEQYLQSSGYYATVFYPYGKTKADKIDDFERDFAGLTVDNGMNGGPVIFVNGRLAERDFYGADLRSLLAANGIGAARVVSAAFTPADQYLRRVDDERFDPSNVIVCYFPLSDPSG